MAEHPPIRACFWGSLTPIRAPVWPFVTENSTEGQNRSRTKSMVYKPAVYDITGIEDAACRGRGRGPMELLGLAEIAALFGVTKQVVVNWRARKPYFPAPIAELRSGPAWQK